MLYVCAKFQPDPLSRLSYKHPSIINFRIYNIKVKSKIGNFYFIWVIHTKSLIIVAYCGNREAEKPYHFANVHNYKYINLTVYRKIKHNLLN